MILYSSREAQQPHLGGRRAWHTLRDHQQNHSRDLCRSLGRDLRLDLAQEVDGFEGGQVVHVGCGELV